MAEERTLGLARAREVAEEDLSKEELQLRMEEARDSITQTVTEIKETVVHQYENVKDALDWREQFKKRPVAWSLGAAGVGFCVGYCIAATIKGEESDRKICILGSTTLTPASRSPAGLTRLCRQVLTLRTRPMARMKVRGCWGGLRKPELLIVCSRRLVLSAIGWSKNFQQRRKQSFCRP